MEHKHPALTKEHLTAIETQSIWQAQHTLMQSSEQSLPKAFQLNNHTILYAALVAEEGGETLEALANAIGVVDQTTTEAAYGLLQKLSALGAMMRKASAEIREDLKALPQFATDFDLLSDMHRNALKPLIDGAADTLVVTAGLMNASGMDGALAYAAAQQSNHTKIDPETKLMYKGADGKWIKGPYFTDPNWDHVIDETIARRK